MDLPIPERATLHLGLLPSAEFYLEYLPVLKLARQRRGCLPIWSLRNSAEGCLCWHAIPLLRGTESNVSCEIRQRSLSLSFSIQRMKNTQTWGIFTSNKWDNVKWRKVNPVTGTWFSINVSLCFFLMSPKPFERIITYYYY